MGRKSVLQKGKEKVTDGKASSSAGKRKRNSSDDFDNDKTGGRKRKDRSVLQFVDDVAYEVDDDDEDDSDFDFSDSDFFDEDLLEEEFGSNVEIKNEPVRTPQPPVIKEEEMDGEELERMLRERYKPGSSFVTYAEDTDERKRQSEQETLVPSLKDPTIWKVKCTVGRERHSAFCLMQKYIDLLALGTKLQIISAFALDHVKGYIYIESDKQCDVYEACKGLCSIYSTRVAPVPLNEVSHLIAVRKKSSGISEGMWARVKSGIYKGDLAQVVAVNDSRKKVTVKLIPRVDLQAIADKFGGGVAAKKGVIPAPRLISSTELEDFRPLIQYRKDRDTNLMFEILDGKMLKDGYLYKKVGTDSLSYWGVMPTEAELLKFEPSSNDEPQDVDWLTQLYGDRKKKRNTNDFKVGQKGGEKGESSSSSSMENNFEVDDLVFFGRNDFGIIIGKEKDDSFKIMKYGSERPVVVSIQLRELKRASFDKKLFTVKDQLTNVISIGDVVRVLDGSLKDKQGTVKQIYRGVVFLYDQSEQDNNGYLCVKGQMCERIASSGGVSNGKGSEPGPSGLADFSSSPKSPLSPEKSWRVKDDNSSFKRGDDNEMFSVGQSLRIRVGPLKGYLCRVIAIRRSDVTVKLDSQQKILTVKSEHLAEVHAKSSVVSLGVDGDSSKPFDLLGTQDGSDDWMVQGATATEGNTGNASWGASGGSDRTVADAGQDDGWAKATSAVGATSGASDGWGKKVESHQESTEKITDNSWGSSVQKQGNNDDSGKTSWGKQDGGSSWGKQSDANAETDWKKQDGGLDKTDSKTSWSQQGAGSSWNKSDGGSSSSKQAGGSSWGQQSDANAETGWKKQDGGSNKPDSKTSWSQQDAGSSWKKSEGEGGSSWGGKQSDAKADNDWKKQDGGSSWSKPDNKTSFNQQGPGSSWNKSNGGSSWGKQSDANAGTVGEKQDGGSSWSKFDDSKTSWSKQDDGSSWNKKDDGSFSKPAGGTSWDKGSGGSTWNKKEAGSGGGEDTRSTWGKQDGGSSWGKEAAGGWKEGESGNSGGTDQEGGSWGRPREFDGGRGSGGRRGRGGWRGGRDQSGRGGSFNQGRSSSRTTDGEDNNNNSNNVAFKGNQSSWSNSQEHGKNLNEDTSGPNNQTSDFQSTGGWTASKPSNDGWSSSWNKNSATTEVGGSGGNQSDWDKKSGEVGGAAGWDNKITQKASEGNNSAWNSKSAVEQDGNGKNQNDTWKKTSDGGSSTGWGQSNSWKSGTNDAGGTQDSWSSKSNWNSGSGFGGNNQQSDSYSDRGRGGSWRGGRGRSDRGKHIEEELYDSSLKESKVGIEHHLHRGRALAAFNQLLSNRVQKLKSESSRRQHGTPVQGQTNIQSDVQMLLSPITQSEQLFLSSVVPLAIVHFADSVLVASCALLLELCGLSPGILQIDVAALRRIASFNKSGPCFNHLQQLSPRGSSFHSNNSDNNITESLARGLADDYCQNDWFNQAIQKSDQYTTSDRQPSRALMLVLQHLETSSLPSSADGVTCGSWLLTGNGDGVELRSQQKTASEHWSLVTTFCQAHQLPVSTRYLALLARDNDWIGFLSEAQIGGYTLEAVMEVALKEFGDARLKTHILTILKSTQSRKKFSSSSSSDTGEKKNGTSFPDENVYAPAELFGIIAECERQARPGEALLLQAKNLCWSLLAAIASCFPDVSSLSCLTVWLEITAARETSAIKVNNAASQIANNVAAAVEATNFLPASAKAPTVHYNRKNPKRRRLMEPVSVNSLIFTIPDVRKADGNVRIQDMTAGEECEKQVDQDEKVSNDSDEVAGSLSRMVAVLCEQHLFLPLLRAFEMFLPSCSLLPFIRALQAFSQMRLSEASAHLGSFSARIKEEPHVYTQAGKEGKIGSVWISSTAVKAANAMLSRCPSPYEKRCLLHLLTATDFGDGGSAATCYQRLYFKVNLAEPSLRKNDGLHLGNEPLDDASLLTALEEHGHWEQARNWAKHLEASGGSWKSATHHVTETQAESMVAEWKEFLWDVPEERAALWGHCQTLFLRYSFPPLQVGLFFLKHAEAAEKDLPARELHELLLLSLQWLSGMITQCSPVCPLHLLREIETRAWLLAVESETQVKSEGELTLSSREPASGKGPNIIDRTASIITKMDNHINSVRNKSGERNDTRESNQSHLKATQMSDSSSGIILGSAKVKRRAKGFVPSRKFLADPVDRSNEPETGSINFNVKEDSQVPDENLKIEATFSKWEERVGPAELERAVLSLLEFGQIAASRQLQHKLSPGCIPSEFKLVDAALKLAAIATPNNKVSILVLDGELRSVMQSYDLFPNQHVIDPLQVLESFALLLTEGRGRGLCRRIISVVKAANVLGLSFSEAFEKPPIELLQLLSLKAQDSFEEAKLLVQSHCMPAASIAQILAESFLKGLLAAHRGGYMESQKEEGPAPLLWRFSDFLKWAELCPSEPEIGHALLRLVATCQGIPHACEVELLILSHHFYKSSACLDGVDVLVDLAFKKVEAYVSEGDFPCLARLVTGVGNFHALNFILGILIENGQLDLLLQKFSAAVDANDADEEVRGFRMAVLTLLKQFNPNDLDAFAMVYSRFDMKNETASLLESRAHQSCKEWSLRSDKDQTDELLASMGYFIEAAEVYSSIDAGSKTRQSCAQALLLYLQIRMPDLHFIYLSETNARRALVEQTRFQEALIVAEAYGLNQPGEWALVLWNQMLRPELIERFMAEFVSVLPLQPSMLLELARFYRAEVAARGDQSQFSMWLTGGGLPADWAKYLGRSFRCLLRRTRDLRLRYQLATIATGFTDVINACNKAFDKVPDSAGPLVLRKGHGGGYLPLM